MLTSAVMAAVFHLPRAERVQCGVEPKTCWVGSHHSDADTDHWHVLRRAHRLCGHWNKARGFLLASRRAGIATQV